MKIGLIGGYGHNILRHFPEGEFSWACDGYDQEALNKAEAAGIKNVFQDVETMLAEFTPDIVYVGSAYGRNGSIALRMLERGFSVVSEKPLATEAATFGHLVKATGGGKRGIVAELTMRGSPEITKVRELVQSGRIGSPVLIQAQKTYKFGNKRPSFYKEADLFGGIIPWVAIHAIDYAMWCSGLRYESVQATQGNRCFPDYPGMEDHAAMLFRMSGGVPCLITADFLRPRGAPSHGDDRLRITGSSGIVELRGDLVCVSDGEKTEEWDLSGETADAASLAREMVSAALDGESTLFSTSDAMHVTAAALAAKTSAAANGETIKIEE